MQCNFDTGDQTYMQYILRVQLMCTTSYTELYFISGQGSEQLRQINLDWIDICRSNPFIRRTKCSPSGIMLRVSWGNKLLLDAKDAVLKLYLVAPSTTNLHLKGCTTVKKLHVDCKLL